MPTDTTAERPAKFAELLRIGEYRAVYSSMVLSEVGDQLARVALTLLVFERTRSASLAALTYALTLLPDLVSGPLLSGLGDRYPRRAVMIVTDLVRAGLVALMVVPGMPLWFLCLLVVLVQMLQAPFMGARVGVIARVLTKEQYVAASAVGNMTIQLSFVAGYALGGPLVLWLGTNVALLLDAATFLLSALVLRTALQVQPATKYEHKRSNVTALWTSMTGCLRLIWRSGRLRTLWLLAVLPGFLIVPEGLIAPYAAELGGGVRDAAILFPLVPAGTVIGMWLFVRLVPPERRLRWMGPLAVASCAALTLCLFSPPFPIVVVAYLLSGVAACYDLPAGATFVMEVPDSARGQAFGLRMTMLNLFQGGGVLLGGLFAGHFAVSAVIGWAGLIGVLIALALTFSWYSQAKSAAVVERH
ncbi:MFS transporter [Amycolatopsis sp. cmx-11-12]|uniref:MFS transporter n=1 Tax=Amycolatopsis sp. cmx-11-12 TaxID=2785795 RepID=UPI0039180D04